eukprot:TRINITY_DN3426_c0_g2_i2.p1 TRINITY_DN3426_c0_g2~~TRINITY_DN3426_c0_g2_i2.p1  ORF type:complete len:129 (-),score=14.94 TRINITY_DN3426_c0_g2_i2:1630-1992(-)
MIRRPPRSTHCISSAASDVYKRQRERILPQTQPSRGEAEPYAQNTYGSYRFRHEIIVSPRIEIRNQEPARGTDSEQHGIYHPAPILPVNNKGYVTHSKEYNGEDSSYNMKNDVRPDASNA